MRIRADEGSSFYVRRDLLALLDPQAEPPRVGDRLEGERLELLRRADEASRAAYKGLELLVRAEHTRFLLSRKLLAREFPEAAVRLALDALEAEGALDEGRYAEAWIRSRLTRGPRGPAELLAGLLSRGVDGGLARGTVARLFGPEERAAAIRTLARGKLARMEDGARLARLRSLGFGRSEVLEAMEALGEGSAKA